MNELIASSLRLSNTGVTDVYLQDLSGSAPNQNFGSVNDYVLDVSTGKVYKKTSSTAWELYVSCIDGFKQRVRVATTLPGTLSTSFQNGSVVDGVSLITGDRILIKDQASGFENGIYIVQVSGSPVRALDSDSDSEIRASLVAVLEGTVNAGEFYKNSNTSVITFGVTSILYSSIGSGGGGTYTNASPTPVTLGGIPAGSTFSSVTFQDMFDSLLYPYQSPAFTSFTSSLFSTYEVGQDLTSGINTINYNISNSANFLPVQPNGLQTTNITGATFVLADPLSLVASGSFQITIPVSFNLTSPGTRTVSLSGTNTNSVVFSSTGTATWRYRIYYGNESNSSLVAAQVLALSNNPLSANSSGNYSYPAAAGTYKWICYPTTMTTLTTFTDTSTNLNVPFEAPVVVSITNGYGVIANYNCHRSTNQLGGAINIAMS